MQDFSDYYLSAAALAAMRLRPDERSPTMSDTTQPGEHRFAVEFRKTRYDGYRSYSYLDDRDCEPFVLAPELGRVPLYDLGLDEEQAARTRKLIDENVVISLHDHP